MGNGSFGADPRGNPTPIDLLQATPIALDSGQPDTSAETLTAQLDALQGLLSGTAQGRADLVTGVATSGVSPANAGPSLQQLRGLFPKSDAANPKTPPEGGELRPRMGGSDGAAQPTLAGMEGGFESRRSGPGVVAIPTRSSTEMRSSPQLAPETSARLQAGIDELRGQVEQASADKQAGIADKKAAYGVLRGVLSANRDRELKRSGRLRVDVTSATKTLEAAEKDQEALEASQDERYRAQNGTLMTVLRAIAMGAGAFAEAFSGVRNQVPQIIESAFARDRARQRIKLQLAMRRVGVAQQGVDKAIARFDAQQGKAQDLAYRVAQAEIAQHAATMEDADAQMDAIDKIAGLEARRADIEAKGRGRTVTQVTRGQKFVTLGPGPGAGAGAGAGAEPKQTDREELTKQINALATIGELKQEVKAVFSGLAEVIPWPTKSARIVRELNLLGLDRFRTITRDARSNLDYRVASKLVTGKRALGLILPKESLLDGLNQTEKRLRSAIGRQVHLLGQRGFNVSPWVAMLDSSQQGMKAEQNRLARPAPGIP